VGSAGVAWLVSSAGAASLLVLRFLAGMCAICRSEGQGRRGGATT
jgi:hypothetical protein